MGKFNVLRVADQSKIEFRKDLWPRHHWRKRLFVIIFGTDTPAGKAFDVALLWAILGSILAVMLESVNTIEMQYGILLRNVEWFFTGVFTLEYIARIISIRKPSHYIFSFYGVIDLLALLPTYLALILAGGQYLLVIRALRLLRVFRIFKLSRYLGEAGTLKKAMIASRHKITVFLGTVFAIVVIAGTLMYMIEGGVNGFTSIPRSIYWAIVTLTTVGYGDIAPQTVIGQALASFIMIMGYAIIAVPTGIVTAEIAQASKQERLQNQCEHCGTTGHDNDARFCKNCGAKMWSIPDSSTLE